MEQNGFELQIKFQPLPMGRFLPFLFTPAVKERRDSGSLLLLVQSKAVLELPTLLPPPLACEIHRELGRGGGGAGQTGRAGIWETSVFCFYVF